MTDLLTPPSVDDADETTAKTPKPKSKGKGKAKKPKAEPEVAAESRPEDEADVAPKADLEADVESEAVVVEPEVVEPEVVEPEVVEPEVVEPEVVEPVAEPEVVEPEAEAVEPEPAPAPSAPTVVWLPAAKPSRKGRVAALLGIPAGVLAVGAGVCGAILIAPGVMAAGVDLGWKTPGAASEVVAAALADTQVTLQTSSRDVVLTGEQLGLSVDAAAVTALAYGEYPLWKVGAWNPGNVPIQVDIDADVALAALEDAAPTVFPAPVDATVNFDRKLGEFEVEPSSAGLGIDLDSLVASVSSALSEGSRAVTIDANPRRLDATISTREAQTVADQLNTLVDDAGFYVGGQEVLAIDPADVASWLTVSEVDGTLAYSVDEDAALTGLWKVVASLPREVNHPAVNEVIVTNSAGDHLRTVQEGVNGWKVGATSGIAAAFVAALAAGDSSYDLQVTEQPYATTLAYRSIEVNKTTGQAILYENGKVVDVYPVAIGRPETPTPEGHFVVFAQLAVQDMGCVPGYDYCTKDVPWISYFEGDNGFHGTYWHDNFGAGAMMSHGCVNMTIAAAERVYYFAQEGTEVWVHS